jgi:hypothetical protein
LDNSKKLLNVFDILYDNWFIKGNVIKSVQNLVKLYNENKLYIDKINTFIKSLVEKWVLIIEEETKTPLKINPIVLNAVNTEKEQERQKEQIKENNDKIKRQKEQIKKNNDKIKRQKLELETQMEELKKQKLELEKNNNLMRE